MVSLGVFFGVVDVVVLVAAGLRGVVARGVLVLGFVGRWEVAVTGGAGATTAGGNTGGITAVGSAGTGVGGGAGGSGMAVTAEGKGAAGSAAGVADS